MRTRIWAVPTVVTLLCSGRRFRSQPTTSRACRPITRDGCNRGSPCSRRRFDPCWSPTVSSATAASRSKAISTSRTASRWSKAECSKAAANECRLVALIRHADEPHMPQKAPKLPDATIADIVRWIDLVRPYDRPLVDRAAVRGRAGRQPESSERGTSGRSVHWPPSSPRRYAIRTWIRTPIDRFILATPGASRAEAESACRPPHADPPRLLRPDGLAPFARGDRRVRHRSVRPIAYERLVDRLLASPHYGERFASHWMDVARFAESHGYEQDYDRPYAYHYRDFLIRAFNDDMPYDQFVRWQLAGDELAPDDPMAMAATGFLGAGPFPTQLTEAEFESARYNELDDMVATTGSAIPRALGRLRPLPRS